MEKLNRTKGISLGLYNVIINEKYKQLRLCINYNYTTINFFTGIFVPFEFFDKRNYTVFDNIMDKEDFEDINSQIIKTYNIFANRFLQLKQNELPIIRSAFNFQIKIKNKIASTPTDLLDIDIEYILTNRFPSPQKGKSYIYFLFNENELVYIGQTRSNLYLRLERHSSDKLFTKYTFYEVSKEELNITEALLIKKFKPKHNKLIF